jgi:hypothetical protein
MQLINYLNNLTGSLKQQKKKYTDIPDSLNGTKKLLSQDLSPSTQSPGQL